MRGKREGIFKRKKDKEGFQEKGKKYVFLVKMEVCKVKWVIK